MTEIRVSVPGTEKTTYPIYIERGFLDSVSMRVEKMLPSKAKFIVTDTNVADAGHLEKLNYKGDIQTFIINPPGETNKTINTVIEIIEQMEQASLGRDSVILALGGGTVGDIAGFAAAIFKRGINVIQIPTTTVSQADSAVGGKTGVDSTVSKNAYGAFYNPTAVFIDVETLTTLSQDQFNAGLVESVKHALIADEQYFDFIEANIDLIISKNTDMLIALAEKNCQIKASVVEEDPYEKNLRRILNYGHTIGHAVESASNFKLLHGQSVAIGIIAAGKIEQQLGLVNDDRDKRINNIFDKLSMPKKIPADISVDTIMDLLTKDKKAVNKWPKFVLLEKIAKIKKTGNNFAVDVTPEMVKDILADMY